MKKLEFYFDFGSPYSYIAYHQLQKFKAQYPVEIIYKPILLGGIFKATNNNSPAMVPHKAQYLIKDLKDWSKYWQIPFIFNRYFPINTFFLMRGAVGYQKHHPEKFEHFVATIFKAMFEHPVNLNDDAEVKKVLEEANLSYEEYQKLINDDEVKEQAKSNTQLAVERGMFGAPTFFIDHQMFWGQDRLHFIEEILKSET